MWAGHPFYGAEDASTGIKLTLFYSAPFEYSIVSTEPFEFSSGWTTSVIAVATAPGSEYAWPEFSWTLLWRNLDKGVLTVETQMAALKVSLETAQLALKEHEEAASSSAAADKPADAQFGFSV